MKLSIILVCFIAFATVCHGAGLTQEIKTHDGFTVRLPSDWKEIPRNVLDAYSDAVAKMAPTAGKQTFAYGFQHSSTQGWLTYPYILVQIKKTGRVPEAQLKSVQQVKQGLEKGAEKVQNSMSAIVSDARFGEPIYDPATHILFTRIGMDVKEVGAVKGLVALLLTQEGIIQIAGYTKASEFESYAPVIESIAKGVILEDRLKYQSQIADSIPGSSGIKWDKVLTGAVKGAIIGGAVGLVAVFFMKRKAAGKKEGGNP